MAKNPNSKIDSSENNSGILDRLKDLDKNKIKKQITVFVLSLMITASAATMEGCGNASEDIPTGITVEDYQAGETEYKFNEEITEFIDQQGSRFGDLEKTVSTYYAELAYEEDGTYQMLNRTEGQRELVSEYELTLAASETDYMSDYGNGKIVDWLGFGGKVTGEVPSNSFAEYSTDQLITDKNMSTEIFNDWVLPSLENYLNRAVKNPTDKERAVVENSFKKFCTFAAARIGSDSNSKFQIMSNGLINDINDIASKYGGNCNFVIKGIDGSSDGQDGSSSLNFENSTSNYFNTQPNYSSEDTNLEVMLSPTICIEVTTFDESGNKTTKIIDETIQITLIQSNEGRLYIGSGSYK